MKKLILICSFIALGFARGYIMRDTITLNNSIREPLFIILHLLAFTVGAIVFDDKFLNSLGSKIKGLIIK